MAWEKLCDRLMGTPLGDLLTIEDEVSYALKEMKYISKTSLVGLEETLKSFFESARSFHAAQLHSSSMLTEEVHSQMISSAMARHADVQSRIEEEEGRLEALEKEKEDICTRIQQEKELLRLLQSDISTLDDDLVSLKDSVPMSKEEGARLQQMKTDLELQQQELKAFRLSF